MAPQLRRKAKVDDLSSASTTAPATKPEPNNQSSTPSISNAIPRSEPEDEPSSSVPSFNQALISSIPPHQTHFSTSPLLLPTQPSILTLLSPINHAAWLSWHSSASILSPVVVKEIRELGMYEDVDGKFIEWKEGVLVLMSKVGYEKFVRWRGRRGKAVLS
jgi:hypothetical protein